jgi:hypothetical protein
MIRTGRHLGGQTCRQVVLFGLCLILAMVTALMTTTWVAHASTTPTTIPARWKTAFGNHLFITTDGTTPYGAAESGNAPGRTLTSTSSSAYNDPSGKCARSPSGRCLEWNLQLNSGYCLAATNSSGEIDIKPCDADGTVWALLILGNTDEWISVEVSNAKGTDYVMTSDNVVDDRLTTDCQGCTPGTYQQWVPLAP